MRSVTITGKHNIDELNKIENHTYQSVRKNMVFLNEHTVNHAKQVQLIRELYMNIDATLLDATLLDATLLENTIKSRLQRELLAKLQGYKSQDIQKDIYHHDTLVTLEDVLEKLVGSKLLCCYCSKPILVLYKNVREPFQWTLDRINNDLSHTKENTCIACLKCNLQRRIIDIDKFVSTSNT